MKNFSYNTKPQEMSAEEVLTNRKKRLRKQQIVFGCILKPGTRSTPTC